MKKSCFLEDDTYHIKFDSEKQIRNGDLFFSINQKSKLQFTKISKNDDDQLIDENFLVTYDQNDYENSDDDNLDIPIQDDPFVNLIDDKNAKTRVYQNCKIQNIIIIKIINQL